MVESLNPREDQIGSLFLYVQSEEDFSSKVLKIAKAEGRSFDILDELVGSLELGVGIVELECICDVRFEF